MFRQRSSRKPVKDIDPDEIFVDSTNPAQFDTDRFEGRIERSLNTGAFTGVAIGLTLLVAAYTVQAWNLQIRQGSALATRANNNQLQTGVIFAPRGRILDRGGAILADNSEVPGSGFPIRTYANLRGIAAVVGYAEPPAKDATGNYFRPMSIGQTGVEAAYDDILAGENGAQLSEVDALKRVVSQSTTQPAKPGQDITLSIDANATQALYDAIAQVAGVSHFIGGAGVMMDVHTGEIIAMTSYPDYPLQTMAQGSDTAAINGLLNNPALPFLNRATQGLFAPGSIVKPYVAVGALMEGVINENTQILSTGSISVPNPYDPAHPSVFKDWRPQGWVDMRHAIAVSSDVYFYEVGGGFQNQPGLGIAKLDQYFKLFGIGSPTGLNGFMEQPGNIPTPAWKAKVFPSDPTWRLGDTYHTAIGQYGVQVTPLEMARAAAALGNGGYLLTPTLVASTTPTMQNLNLSQHALEVVREGMRLGVTDGIVQMLKFPYVAVAAKTGTAQVGSQNQFDNSNIEVLFPYDNPKYVLVIMMEKAPAPVSEGATNVAANFIDWLHQNEPQYLQ